MGYESICGIETVTELKRYLVSHDLFGRNHEVLASSVCSGDIYLAIKDKSTGKVFGAVAHTMKERGELYYKLMHEDDGPCYYRPAKKVLALLTETQAKYALDWREKSHRRVNTQGFPWLPVGSILRPTNGLCLPDVMGQPVKFLKRVDYHNPKVLVCMPLDQNREKLRFNTDKEALQYCVLNYTGFLEILEVVKEENGN